MVNDIRPSYNDAFLLQNIAEFFDFSHSLVEMFFWKLPALILFIEVPICLVRIGFDFNRELGHARVFGPAYDDFFKGVPLVVRADGTIFASCFSSLGWF